MQEGDRVRFAQAIINIFEIANTHRLKDRKLEVLDQAISDIGEALGFSQDEIEQIREIL